MLHKLNLRGQLVCSMVILSIPALLHRMIWMSHLSLIICNIHYGHSIRYLLWSEDTTVWLEKKDMKWSFFRAYIDKKLIPSRIEWIGVRLAILIYSLVKFVCTLGFNLCRFYISYIKWYEEKHNWMFGETKYQKGELSFLSFHISILTLGRKIMRMKLFFW